MLALLKCNWSDSATALAVVNRYLQLPSEAVAIAKTLEAKEREKAKERSQLSPAGESPPR